MNVNIIYEQRFKKTAEYRNKVWNILIRNYLSKFIPKTAHVLDLGCGFGEFIRNLPNKNKWAMDLNPASKLKVGEAIFLQADCTKKWAEVPKMNLIFSSNFLEHLATKDAVEATLHECHNHLQNKGILILMGPNINVLNGKYWDFWDHHTALSDESLAEVLQLSGFKIKLKIAKFLPYTLQSCTHLPLALLKIYLALPIFWGFFGKQFLIIAEKE